MYSVKETIGNINSPTESDEISVKRIVRYLKGAPSAKCLIKVVTLPNFVNVYTDSDWAGLPTTCKSTGGGVVQWGKRNSHSLVTSTENSKPEFCRGRFKYSDDWTCRRDGNETSLARTGT